MSASKLAASHTLAGVLVLATALCATQEAASGTEEELDNPVPYTRAALAKGRKYYLRHCQTCHGFDGRALENVDYEAADLTRPANWFFGTTDADIFRTTRDGAGEDMPPFSDRLDDIQIWELVNYLRSIGPEELRPPLLETPTQSGPKA